MQHKALIEQLRSRALKTDGEVKDKWQLRFTFFCNIRGIWSRTNGNVRMCKCANSIIGFHPLTLAVAFHLSAGLSLHCALSQSTQVNCSALLVLWCIILFPFTLCVWTDSQRKQKLKSLWEKSPEQRIFGQFNLNRPAALLKYTPPAFFLPIFLVDDKNCRSQ